MLYARHIQKCFINLKFIINIIITSLKKLKKNENNIPKLYGLRNFTLYNYFKLS